MVVYDGAEFFGCELMEGVSAGEDDTVGRDTTHTQAGGGGQGDIGRIGLRVEVGDHRF